MLEKLIASHTNDPIWCTYTHSCFSKHMNIVDVNQLPLVLLGLNGDCKRI